MDSDTHDQGAEVGLDDVAELMRRAVETLDELGKAVADHVALPSEMVRLAESVSTARRELYAGLISAGWVAPDGTLGGMDLDERLTREGLGTHYDGRAGEPSG